MPGFSRISSVFIPSPTIPRKSHFGEISAYKNVEINFRAAWNGHADNQPEEMPQQRDLLHYHSSSPSCNVLIFHDDIIMNQPKQRQPWDTDGPALRGFPWDLLILDVP